MVSTVFSQGSFNLSVMIWSMVLRLWLGVALC